MTVVKGEVSEKAALAVSLPTLTSVVNFVVNLLYFYILGENSLGLRKSGSHMNLCSDKPPDK